MKIKNVVAICGITACVVLTGTACNLMSNYKEESKAEKDSVDYGKVTLGEYKGLELEVTDPNVTQDEVESRIKSMVAMNPDKIAIEGRAVENGDLVNIDFVGKLDGKEFDGGAAQGYDLVIGSGSFIPGFEEQIIGMNTGEIKDLNLTFPDPYDNNPDLAGKATVFTVTLNGIYSETPAEFDNAWVERVTKGEQKGTEEYRNSVREELEKYKKESSDMEAQITAINKVIENSQFELSEAGINKELEDIKKQYEQMAASYGIDMAKFAEINNMTQEEFDKKMKENAETKAKQKLVVDEIFKKENMSLEDADYATIEELSGMAKNDLILQYGQEFIDKEVKAMKVEKFIVDNAVKTIKPVETTAFSPQASVEESETSAEAESTEAVPESSSN